MLQGVPSSIERGRERKVSEKIEREQEGEEKLTLNRGSAER